MKNTILLALSLTSVGAFASQPVAPATKAVVGQTANANVLIGGVELPYLARVDTGANVTSIHALNMKVVDGVEDMRANLGKTITFTTVNERGEEREHSTQITNVSTIKNAHGSERRYSVDLDLSYGDDTRSITMTLRDRTPMTYKLLIGRNWLTDHYLVDVSEDAYSLEQ